MSDLILQATKQTQTPFDSIRRYHSDGTEFWTARDLMPMLGYKTWQKFSDALDRAMTACSNSSNQVTEHFLPMSVNTKQAGRPQENFELSRFGCYLIAMNGDPRKPEIAMAQNYFAIKTREAEVVIPKQNDQLRELELRLELAQAERDAAIAQKVLIDKREAVNQFHNETTAALILGAQVVDRVEYRDRTITSDGHAYDGVGITYLQRRYGFRSTTEAWKALESVGLGKDNDRAWKPEIAAVTNLKLSSEYIAELDRLFSRMTRQKLIGEEGLFN